MLKFLTAAIPFCLLLLPLAALWKPTEQWQVTKDRGVLAISFVLGATLFFVNRANNTIADATKKQEQLAQAQELNSALDRQREQLTGVFVVGTNQVIKATNSTADQTRKDSLQQTQSIKSQAIDQLSQVEGATLGTIKCPNVVAGLNNPPGRPYGIMIGNLDEKLNMYDINVEVIEFGPSGPGEPWGTVLQQKVLHIPLLTPPSGQILPFTFMSDRRDIDLQLTVTTRGTRCYGRLGLFDTGKDGWVVDHAVMHSQDGKLAYDLGEHRSPGLAQSLPDKSIHP
jgi:hypothetical protein